jgi:hypothetical protein
MLSARTSSLLVCSAYASFPDVHAQHAHQFLTRMLSARTSSWCACSVHASIPYAHAEGIQNEHLKNTKTDAHVEHARQELMRMLRVRISSWRARSGCASVPDPYAQRAHKGRSMRLRNYIFLIIFKVPKTSEILKNLCWRLQMVSKASEKKIFFCPNSKKNPP